MSSKIILMDADNTLLDFSKAEEQALKITFQKHNLYYDDTILSSYSEINLKCWQEFEKGLIDKPTLLIERYKRLFELYHIQADPNIVRRTYQEELGKGYFMIPGAFELCSYLHQYCRIYIVTNGVSETQHSRFAGSGLDKIVHGVFVSEDIGYQKPSLEYFHYVFEHIPNFDIHNCLLVGDSLTADIEGGIHAGLTTCWYNPHNYEKPAELQIDYIIHDLKEIYTIVNNYWGEL